MKRSMLSVTLLGLALAGHSLAARPGDLAPNFTLQDAKGRQFQLSGLRGEPVVLTFWATWCTVCEAMMPEHTKLAASEKFPNLFAISPTDRPAAVLRHFQKSDLASYTPLVDASGVRGTNTTAEVARAYRVIGQPVTVFIAADGKISAVRSGYLPEEQFLKDLRAIRAK